jgi:RNA recognition motif-containing protein
MTTDDEASHAIEVLDGKEFKGRPLKINEARAREPRSAGYTGSGAQRR